MKNRMADVFQESFQVEHNKSFEVQDAVFYAYGIEYHTTTEQDDAIEHAVLNHDKLTQQVEEMKEALTDISNMCVGEIVMGYKLDAQCVGEVIYKATGMTNPELNKVGE